MGSKTVIITGADGNLGSAAVDTFLKIGANVIAVYYGAKPEHIDESVLSIEKCNLTEPAQASGVIQFANDIKLEPDVLINIAGGFLWKEIKETSPEDFEAQFSLNFKTMYNMTMAALPKISRSQCGRIINIGAMGAVSAGAGMAAYAVSKSAVMRFTEALAAEADDNVTVNAILPSIIDTPENRRDMPDADTTKWVSVDELVDAMKFLSSNEASGINGVLLPVTGRL